MNIKRNGFVVNLSEPVLAVDNKSRGRSGHMSHAMTMTQSGKLICFNSNCSPVRLDGHTPYGWVEYRFSEDNGKTFSDFNRLEYSWQAIMDGKFTVSVEKAVTASNGNLVAFCLRNTMLREICCEPWLTPTYVISRDEGKSWEVRALSPYEGRVYDAKIHDGVIYVLQHCINDENAFTLSGIPVYRVFASYDSGETFTELAVLPIESEGRAYGAMMIEDSGRIHAYAYNIQAEQYMDHVTSVDGGKTWKKEEPCFVEKKIRNPQINVIDGVFVCHGRAGGVNSPFVLYTSVDGYLWDEGEYIAEKKNACYYSCNIVLTENGKNELLIQYSDVYEACRVNVMHRRLTISKC